MLTDTTWIVWAVPAAAFLMGGVGFLAVWISSRQFDRRYGKHGHSTPAE